MRVPGDASGKWLLNVLLVEEVADLGVLEGAPLHRSAAGALRALILFVAYILQYSGLALGPNRRPHGGCSVVQIETVLLVHLQNRTLKILRHLHRMIALLRQAQAQLLLHWRQARSLSLPPHHVVD